MHRKPKALCPFRPTLRVLAAAASAAALALAGCSDSTGPSEPEVFETFVVDPSGAGDFLTIQEGLNAVANGDTLLLVPGLYTGPGNQNLLITGVSPVVMGTGRVRQETVIDCQGSGRGFYIGGGAAPVIENLTVTNGDTLRGGGMYLEGTSPMLRNVRFLFNRAGHEGGGLFCRNGSPALSDVLFDDNIALVAGGAIHCQNSSMALTGVTFNNNAAQGSGGGMSCIFSTPDLSECVFWRNSAIFGAGIYCGSSDPAVTSCTFALNEAEEGAGLYAADASSPSIRRSIIAFSAHGKPMDCGSGSDPFTSHCCIYANADGDTLCGDYSTSMLYVDPLFCGLESGDLTLRTSSPCLPDNNQWDILIGALGAGCGLR